MKKLIFIFTTMLLVANLGFSQTIIYESPERPTSSVSLEDDGWVFSGAGFYEFSNFPGFYTDYLHTGHVNDPSPTVLFMTRDFSNEPVGLSTYNGFKVELELQGAHHSTHTVNNMDVEVYLAAYIVDNSTLDTLQSDSVTVTVAGYDETATFHTISLNGITEDNVSIVISIGGNVSYNTYTLYSLKNY